MGITNSKLLYNTWKYLQQHTSNDWPGIFEIKGDSYHSFHVTEHMFDWYTISFCLTGFTAFLIFLICFLSHKFSSLNMSIAIRPSLLTCQICIINHSSLSKGNRAQTSSSTCDVATKSCTECRRKSYLQLCV